MLLTCFSFCFTWSRMRWTELFPLLALVSVDFRFFTAPLWVPVLFAVWVWVTVFPEFARVSVLFRFFAAAALASVTFC